MNMIHISTDFLFENKNNISVALQFDLPYGKRTVSFYCDLCVETCVNQKPGARGILQNEQCDAHGRNIQT